MTNANVIIKVPSIEAVEAYLNGGKTFTTDTAGELFSLTPKDRKTMNKAADKSAAFVDKGVFYIANSPQFCPAGLNLDLMKVDADTISTLVPLQKRLTDILSQVTDTITIARSEQLRGVRKYYNSIVQAAKENEPGAKTIFDDMRKRFEGQGRKKDKPEEVATKTNEEAAKAKDSDVA